MAKVTLLFQSFNPFQKRVVFLDRSELKATIAEKRGHIKEDRQDIKEAKKDYRETIQEKRREIRERAKAELRALRTEVETMRAKKRLESPKRDLTGLVNGDDLPDSPQEVQADLATRLARAEALVRDLQARLAASPTGNRASATGGGSAGGGETPNPAQAPERPLAIPVDEVDLLEGT